MRTTKVWAIVLLCVAVIAKKDTEEDPNAWKKYKPPTYTDYFCSTCLNVVNEMNFWLADVKNVTENVAVAVLITKIPDAMQEYVKTPHPNMGGGYLLVKALPDMGSSGIVLGGPEIANFTEIIKSKYQLQLVKAAMAREDHEKTKTHVCKELAKVCTDIQDLPKVVRKRREEILKTRNELKSQKWDDPVEWMGTDTQVRSALRKAGLARTKTSEDKYIDDYNLYQKAKEQEEKFEKKHAMIIDKFLHSDRAMKMTRKERDKVVDQYIKDKEAAKQKYMEESRANQEKRRKRTEDVLKGGSHQKATDEDSRAAKAKKEHYAKKERKEVKRKVKNEL